MVPELEKTRVTELQVRMDCNGCVQKIKKAMHSIDGVYSVDIDIAQQKLTVVGNADPEKIVRAIKKRRKTATICSHTEPGEPQPPPPPPTEQAASSDPPAPEAANQPPTEAAPPPDPPAPENPAPDAAAPEAPAPVAPKDVEEVHMVHSYPHNYYVSKKHWNHHSSHETPYYATHSYSSYRPSPYVSEYGYLHHSPPPQDIRYSDSYYRDYRAGGDGSQITSMFSDENPNACRIV